MIYSTTNADGENSLQQHSTLHVRLISHINQQTDAPFSALETVGLETMTGRTLGALVMAPRWTMPMRPQPMTPTLISFSSAPESVMERADRVRKEAADEAEGAKASVEAAHARKRRAEKRIVASSIRYVVGSEEVMPGGRAMGDVCHAFTLCSKQLFSVFRILQVESDKIQKLSFLRHHDADADWGFVIREIGTSCTRIGGYGSATALIRSISMQS